MQPSEQTPPEQAPPEQAPPEQAPPEQAPSQTSLELPSADSPSADSSLAAGPSAAGPSGADRSEAGPSGAGPLGELLTAHFRRVEVAMLGRVLITTLSGALPPSMIRVEHRRSLGRRLVGRAGEPVGVTVTFGDQLLSFRAPEVGEVEARVSHVVRGVVLSTTPVPLAQWLDELGDLLERSTRADEATRTALERALLS